eukprot:evm.model.scf_1977.3 EVM.evm.TU.scf_1977.3   scf_1977:13739-17164(-)
MAASELGLREYWDAAYADELEEFEKTGDEGEIWFGGKVQKTMVDWADELIRSRLDRPGGGGAGEYSVLDVGTGNGAMLRAMAEKGYQNLVGTDYSERAIELATQINKKTGCAAIVFMVDDVLESKLAQRFDVVLDKGTYDAIGLSPDGEKKRGRYFEAVWKLLKPNGLLVLTSCNCTNEELTADACREAGPEQPAVFGYVDDVKTYPTFQFGGKVGSTVCTVAFRRLG